MKRKRNPASANLGRSTELHKPDIIHGASVNDLAEVRAAVDENRSCILQIDPATGGTALHIAAYRANLELASFLLAVGPEAQFQEDRLGRTPCEIATSSGYIELGRLFTTALAAKLNLGLPSEPRKNNKHLSKKNGNVGPSI